MKYSVCIDAVFMNKKLSLTEQLRMVKEAGFSLIEFWFWWDKDLDELRDAMKQYNISVSTFCTRFISLTDKARLAEYMEGLKESIKAAKFLGAHSLISQVGNYDETVCREEQRKNLEDGLKSAVPILEESGITLLVEPLNTRVDHAGYFLISSEEAYSILEEVNSNNIKMLFDIYHQQISEGDLTRHIESFASRIGHFHAADNPGRNHPGTGEINYTYLFRKIHSLLPEVPVGLEYFTDDPVESLWYMRNNY